MSGVDEKRWNSSKSLWAKVALTIFLLGQTTLVVSGAQAKDAVSPTSLLNTYFGKSAKDSTGVAGYSSRSELGALTTITMGPTYQSGVSMIMADVISDIVTGYGNRWGAVNPNLDVIDGVSPAKSLSQVANEIYPLFEISSGRAKFSPSCGSTVTGEYGDVAGICEYIKTIKYTKLLTDSCSQGYAPGPSITSASKVTSCPQNSSSGNLDASNASMGFDTSSFASSIQTCSASVCGSSSKASLQTKKAQLWNGWTDTCSMMQQMANFDCRRLQLNQRNDQISPSQVDKSNDLFNQCQCIKYYLTNGSQGSNKSCQATCNIGKAQVNYSSSSTCPPVDADGFRANADSVKAGQYAKSNMSVIGPCLNDMNNKALQLMMKVVYQQALTKDSTDAEAYSTFGSIETLIGKDNYNDPGNDKTVSNKVFTKLQDFAGGLDLSKYSFLPPKNNTFADLAALYITMISGSSATDAVLPSPSLPTSNNDNIKATVLKNGKFISFDGEGVVLDEQGKKSSYKLSSSDDISQIQTNQTDAKDKLTSNETMFNATKNTSDTQKMVALGLLYDLYAARVLELYKKGTEEKHGFLGIGSWTVDVDPDLAITKEELSATKAMWRLDSSVGLDADNNYCVVGKGQDCKAWSEKVADMNISQLLYEIAELLKDLGVQNYEVQKQEEKIQLLQSILAARGDSTAIQKMSTQKSHIANYAKNYYQGAPSADQAMNSFSSAAAAHSGQ